MSFDLEMATKIQKYLLEVKGQELSIGDILKRPRWKRVWYWWLALEHFEGKPMPNITQDNAKRFYGDE